MLERIDSSSPPVLSGCLSPPLGRGVNVLPCGGQAIKKRAEVVSSPRWWLAIAITCGGQLLLRVSNCFQQRDRVQRSKLLAQLICGCFVDIRRGRQTLTWVSGG